MGPGLDAGLRCLPLLACGTGWLGLGLALLVVTEDTAPRGTLEGPRDEERGPGGEPCAWAPASSVSSQPLLPWGRGPSIGVGVSVSVNSGLRVSARVAVGVGVGAGVYTLKESFGPRKENNSLKGPC